jgi:lipoate synthase
LVITQLLLELKAVSRDCLVITQLLLPSEHKTNYVSYAKIKGLTKLQLTPAESTLSSANRVVTEASVKSASLKIKSVHARRREIRLSALNASKK